MISPRTSSKAVEEKGVKYIERSILSSTTEAITTYREDKEGTTRSIHRMQSAATEVLVKIIE